MCQHLELYYHVFLNGSKTRITKFRNVTNIRYHAILNGSKTSVAMMLRESFIRYHAILNGSKTSNSKTFIACLL